MRRAANEDWTKVECVGGASLEGRTLPKESGVEPGRVRAHPALENRGLLRQSEQVRVRPGLRRSGVRHGHSGGSDCLI